MGPRRRIRAAQPALSSFLSLSALRAGGEEVGRGCALPFRRRSLVARAGVGAFVFAGVRQPLDAHHGVTVRVWTALVSGICVP